MNSLPTTTTIAIVGSGAMGSGIAQIAATIGHNVLLYDSRPEAAANAVASLATTFQKLSDKGKMNPAEARQAQERLHAVPDLSDLQSAGLVIEAIVEDLAVKQSLFRDLEAVVADSTILASNTSSLSITAIAAALKNPARLIGMHFFNPAPLMPLVEIVTGLCSDETLAQRLFDTAQAWGKTPVFATSTPGFIVNRLARPYYGEALRLRSEQVASCATIDALCRDAGGFRMGPFELMDMIGHDVNYAVTTAVWQAYHHDPRFTPSIIQGELVAAGWLGRKSGRGFYDYRDAAPPPLPTEEAPEPAPSTITIYGESATALAFAERLKERQIPYHEAPAKSNLVANADGCDIALSDGRTATQLAATSGVAATVVLDLALDYRLAKRLAFAAALQCPVSAVKKAIGFLQALGLAPCRLRDRPGLALMRTVAMLANEAADAVNQGVCSVEAANTAMRLGTNYPLGPLTWADSIGLPRLTTVITELANYYGEDRYRLSPWLRERAGADIKCCP